MATLTQQDVISWLRARAKRLTDAADALEEMTKGMVTNGTVTLEMLRTRLLKGHSRVPQLAKEFGVEQSAIRQMIARKDSGIVVLKRAGWLELKKEANGQ